MGQPHGHDTVKDFVFVVSLLKQASRVYRCDLWQQWTGYLRSPRLVPLRTRFRWAWDDKFLSLPEAGVWFPQRFGSGYYERLSMWHLQLQCLCW